MDQTAFNQSQEVLQAPPQEVKPVVEQPVEKKTNKKMIILIGLVVLTLFLFLVMAILSMSQNGNGRSRGLVATPSPTPQRPQSEFSKKLDDVDKQIDRADPLRIDLEPPPLNYRIRF